MFTVQWCETTVKNILEHEICLFEQEYCIETLFELSGITSLLLFEQNDDVAAFLSFYLYPVHC